MTALCSRVVSFAAALAPVTLAVCAALLAACGAGGDVGDNEVLGRDGAVIFGAESKLAFTQRLVAGSAFAVSFRTNDPEELSLAGASLQSSDDAVLTVEPGTALVALVQPGVAELQVIVAGVVVDAIELHAGKVGATTLVDQHLLSQSATIDARLPGRFAVRTDSEHTLLVAAVDVCGGDLFDLHASTLTSGDPPEQSIPLSVTNGGAAAFLVATQVPGELTLVLKTPGLTKDLEYLVQSIDPGQVDEVQVGLTQVDEAGGVTLWGRAFIDDVELIGDLQLTWTADERITLGAVQGTIVGATVALPADGEAVDDRPAVVTAEIFGEEASVDVLTVTALTTSRGAPARELVLEEPAQGCGAKAAAPCDPELALLAILGVRRLAGVRIALRRRHCAS